MSRWLRYARSCYIVSLVYAMSHAAHTYKMHWRLAKQEAVETAGPSGYGGRYAALCYVVLLVMCTA
jgi:hypothetical protein